MPDSGFSEFDFGEENENNETPTSELLRKCRIARMESTLAKVRENFHYGEIIMAKFRGFFGEFFLENHIATVTGMLVTF